MSSDYYFWEPSLSPHKLDLFRALSQSSNTGSCMYIAQEGLPESRLLLGWQTNTTNLDIRIAPSFEEVQAIMENAAPNSIHLFSGIHWVPIIVAGLRAAIKYNRRFALMHEPRDPDGMIGKIRLLHSWISEWSVRRHIAFVLAIGRHGPDWFRAAGYSASIIYPFAYLIPPITSTVVEPFDRTPRVAFVGRLVAQKGLQQLLDAFKGLHIEFHATIAGTGPLSGIVEQAASNSNGRINYLGTVSMSSIGDVLKRADIVIVPSLTKDDGWGVIVSEALLAGTYVIASNNVGASVCLAGDRGTVIDEVNQDALVTAITAAITDVDFSAQGRRSRSKWAEARLTGIAGAEYLISIANHVFSNFEKPRPFFE